jgi:hypothetical protein
MVVHMCTHSPSPTEKRNGDSDIRECKQVKEVQHTVPWLGTSQAREGAKVKPGQRFGRCWYANVVGGVFW